MADHYYTSNPNSKSNPEKFTTSLLGHSFEFTTDSGVFSKDKIDYGSKVLIEAVVDSELIKGDLLDMGCGYGPIGISLANKFKDKTIHMVDVNERALDLARGNALDNKVENVEIYQSSTFEEVKKDNFAGVITNPPIRAGKKVVHEILEDSYNYLKDGGQLFVVIQKKQGAPSAKKKMEEVFDNVERIVLDNGYWVLMSQK